MANEEGKTIAEHAKDLRTYAELTAKAKHSNNWDNFESLALQMLQAAFEAGKKNTVG